MPVSLTLFLAAMAASLMVSGAAAIAALREPGLGLKPLWALLALTGLGGAHGSRAPFKKDCLY